MRNRRVAVILIAVGLLAACTKVVEVPGPVEIVTVTESPSSIIIATPEPVVVVNDPIDEAMTQLKSDIYVQQFCDQADRSGVALWAKVLEIGKPWRSGTIGSAWVQAENTTGYDLNRLGTEFYRRYC